MSTATIRLKVRSTTVAFSDDGFREALVTEDGQHYVIEYGPAQIALLNKQYAAYVADHCVKVAIAGD